MSRECLVAGVLSTFPEHNGGCQPPEGTESREGQFQYIAQAALSHETEWKINGTQSVRNGLSEPLGLTRSHVMHNRMDTAKDTAIETPQTEGRAEEQCIA